jgi:hypothetical protein
MLLGKKRAIAELTVREMKGILTLSQLHFTNERLQLKSRPFFVLVLAR